MVHAIIFDLDNCLCPADAAGLAFYQPAFAAIAAANDGLLTQAVLEQAFDDCWRDAFDVVAARYGFSEAMRSAGFRAFSALEVTSPLRGYDDLDVLPTLTAARYLVTTGFEGLQKSKIRALGIERHFAAIHIDALEQGGARRGKQGIFEEIMRDAGLECSEVMVVGDSAHSELAAGERLGMTTVQTLRPGVPFAPDADHHVLRLSELSSLL